MSMGVQFPLFVFERDNNSMCLVENPQSILHRLEAIDIENDEYLFWDSTGAGVNISVERGGVNQVILGEQPMSLENAFQKYAESHRLRVIAGKFAMETWRNLQSQLPPRKTLWERLFHKSAS